jgi:beta-lactamase regulating signal transducer with metallopeptidase domain
MTTALSLNAIAQAISSGIAECLVEGTVILLLAALLSWALRRQNSGTRFVVWFSALLGIAVIPWLRVTWPSDPGNAQAAGGSAAAITLPGSWALYLFSAWAVIAGIALLRVGSGLWQLFILRRNSVTLDPNTLQPEVQQSFAELQRSRNVAIRVSERVHAPTAVGLMRPAVILPAWLLEDLSGAELKQILLHEMAHLRRWDDWSNLVQKVVKALLFFHPAVWWIEQKLSLEREMACDEAVVAATANPRAYAQCLARLAERSFLRRSVLLAQAAVGRVRQTSVRVARILEGSPSKATRAWRPAFGAVVVLAVAGLALHSQAPDLVAFESTPAGVGSGALTAAVAKPPAEIAQARPALTAIPVQQRAQVNPTQHRVMAKAVRPHATPRSAGPAVALLRRPSVERVAPVPVIPAKGSVAIPVYQETFLVFVQNGRGASVTQTVWQIQIWQMIPPARSSSTAQGTPEKVI